MKPFLLLLVFAAALLAQPQVPNACGANGQTPCTVVTDGLGNVTLPGSVSVGKRLLTPVAYGTGLTAHGDSISAGSLASNPAMNGYVGLLSTDIGGPFNNYSVSGYQAADVSLLTVYPKTNPQSSHGPIQTVMIGINDASQYAANADKQANYSNIMSGILAWLAIPQSSKVFGNDAAVTKTGSWTTDALGANGTTILTNGALTAGTSWTRTGDMALAANVATYTHSTGVGTLQQAIVTLASVPQPAGWYAFIYTISATSGTSPACSISNAFASVATPLNMAAGTNTTYIYSASALSSVAGAFVVSCTSSATGAFTMSALALDPVLGVLGTKSNTNGNTASATIVTTGAPIYVGYKVTDSNGGVATVSIDSTIVATLNATGQNGAAILTANAGTSSAIGLFRYPVAAGSHTILVTITSATSGSNVFSLEWIGTVGNTSITGSPLVFAGGITPNGTGGTDVNALAYNGLVQTVVTTLQGDGLPIYFVPVRNYINVATDYTTSDTIHPNNLGHTHLRDAFDSVINPSLFGGAGINLGKGQSIKQWDPTASAGNGTLYPILGQDSVGNLALTAPTGKYICFSANMGNDGCGLLLFSGTEAASFMSTVTATKFLTIGNCNSTASPAVCSSYPSGGVVIAAGTTSVVVNTSAVSSYNQIQLTFDAGLGTKLSVTCNATYAPPYVSARSAGASFTISTAVAPITNPACYSYTIIN
jgi:hypothetical protein